MDEQKPVKKKTGIVKRIFLWLWRVVLVCLLAAGLYFQAPWKVVTLLLIFLLACTILPRKFRKWFRLSVGIVIVALIIWVFLPEDNQGWRPYTFDAELAAIEAARAIPESENAAVIYNQLLADYDANVFGYDFLGDEQGTLTSNQPWKSKDYPEIAKWLKSQKGTISKLMEAAKMDKCRFPVSADILSFNETSRWSPMRQWAFLLIRSANNDLGRKKTDKAIEKNLAVLGMANHQYQQPMLIDMLMGVGCEALAIRQFNNFIITGDATEKRLDVIEDAVTEIRFDWTSDFPLILSYEKLSIKSIIGRFYEVNSNGKVRFNRNPSTTIAIETALPSSLSDYWLKKLLKTKAILTWFFVPSNPQKTAEIVDDAYERRYAMADADYDWEKEPEQIRPKFKLNYSYYNGYLTYILRPAYHRVHDLYLRLLTDKSGCQIMIGLRRYKNENGCWPETLDDIIDLVPAEVFTDAFSGKAFVYKLTDDGFTLYSIGKNGIDEAGERAKDYGTKINNNEPCADDWLIWPRSSSGCSK